MRAVRSLRAKQLTFCTLSSRERDSFGTSSLSRGDLLGVFFCGEENGKFFCIEDGNRL